jgi:hypothetical protein
MQRRWRYARRGLPPRRRLLAQIDERWRVQVAGYLQDGATASQIADELAARLCHAHDDDVDSAIHQVSACTYFSLSLSLSSEGELVRRANRKSESPHDERDTRRIVRRS